MILAILLFGVYVGCVLFIGKLAFSLGVLVLQVAIKCLPYVIGIWIALMVLKGCVTN